MVLHKIIIRLMKLLNRRVVLVEEEGSTYIADNDGDSDQARVLRPLLAAACTYCIAFSLRAGQKVLTLQGAMPGRRTSSRRCVSTATASACTVRCAARPMNAMRRSGCAAT